MEYNPYMQKYNRLSDSIERKKSDKNTLVNELRWFDSIDIDRLIYSLEEKEKSNNNFKTLIENTEKEIETLNRDIQKVKKFTKNLLNPSNWFDNDQKSYRKKLNGLKKELRSKQEYKEKMLKLLLGTDKSINKISSAIAKYKCFDRQKVSDEIGKLDGEIILLKEELKRVSDKKNKVDIALQPVMDQIEKYEFSILSAEEKISEAQLFERKLSDADNSYERAMIHKECEDVLGESSPKTIIIEQQKLIRKNKKDLEKTKKRAIKIGKEASRDIRKIVIDGNNMCYEDGNNFVGLGPLIESTIYLHEQYEVIIIFDSAIRSQLQTNDQTIKEKFNNNIKVHVVATKQLADETILDIASSDDFCYILSNDRFGEYLEKEVVKNSRLIRHEIVDGKVFVHDLNIDAMYA